MKYVPPSINETAFNCPHCGALAKQYWYSVRADKLSENSGTPLVLTQDKLDSWDLDDVEDQETKERLLTWGKNMVSGLPFFDPAKDGNYSFQHLHNFHVSRCFNCDDIALWVFNRLVYPQSGEAPPANADMPDDIKRDYDEASSILDLSPRGAAALIRLCIDKLCGQLGDPKKSINDNIRSLVSQGLDPRIQKALDAVRVIGNNAVHPGEIDLRDDRPTAESLFKLLNLIVEKMISEPKHVDEVYSTLPEGALRAIEKRDGK